MNMKKKTTTKVNMNMKSEYEYEKKTITSLVKYDKPYLWLNKIPSACIVRLCAQTQCTPNWYVSGPGGCRINLSKCTKNAAKCGNVTLTIAYHENEINLNESLKKMTFSQKTFLTLSMVTLANRGHKTASRAEPIFWGQTDLTQWGHIWDMIWYLPHILR